MSQSNARRINLVGSTTIGMAGEKADEVLLVDELRKQGQIVNFIPRDIWKGYVDGDWNDDWKQYLDLEADINIVCKWYHWNDKKYFNKLKEESGAKIMYWVWDWMDGFPHYHKGMVKACDLYLGNDVMHPQYKGMDNCYYFPFDCADGNLPTYIKDYKYDVVFFGSCFDKGVRKEWLSEIALHCDLKIFASNWKEWKKMGFDAEPAVYGSEFAKKVSQSKICLQMSVDDNTWGYWSNRTGKVLTQGGFLLAHYAPGMELFLRNGVAYFKDLKDCIQKIDYYLEHKEERNEIADNGFSIGQRFTVEARIKDLLILIENI